MIPLLYLFSSFGWFMLVLLFQVAAMYEDGFGDGSSVAVKFVGFVSRL